MHIRQALMKATHVLLGQSPEVDPQDKNMAAITILKLVKEVDELHAKFEQFVAQRMAEEQARGGQRVAQA